MPKRTPRRVPPGRDVARVADRVPSRELRLRRGPRPPDDVIAALERALAVELDRITHFETGLIADADLIDGAVRLGVRWVRAITAAARAITVRASRGVLGALAGNPTATATATAAPVNTPETWIATTTAAVEASATAAIRDGRGPAAVLERASGVAAASVLQEHARQVRERAIAAGSHGYIWTTQRDSRVRATHAALEGTRQRWDAPPLTDPPDFHGHPGQPKFCRCQPWPLIRIRTSGRTQ